MNLQTSNFYEIAKIIDNSFYGKGNTFSAYENNDVITLNTNQCDDCSIVKMRLVDGVFIIRRIGPDTDGWEQVTRDIEDRVKGYLLSLV